MELRQLQYFLAVCKELNFTRASENLNISQPSLSQQIKNLEEELGIPLFDRIGKRIAITEAGKIFQIHCYRIFHELEQAQAALRDLNGLQRGELRIGAELTEMNPLLSTVILKYKEIYPNINLFVQGLRTEEIRKALLENELDFGVVFLPVEDEELESIPLFSEQLSFVVPVNHYLARYEEIELKQLEDVHLILQPEDYFLRKQIDEFAEELDVKLKPTLELTAIESMIELVSQGVGGAILPELYLKSLQDERIKRIKLINPKIRVDIGIVYRRDKFMCAATKEFIFLLKDKSVEINEGIVEEKVL